MQIEFLHEVKPAKDFLRSKFPSDFVIRREILYLWLRALLWCAVIFILSSIPNYTGKQADFETLHGILDFCLRKFAHFFEYMVLMVFVFRAVQNSWGKFSRWHFLSAFAFAILFSISDEWHQTFVFGRSGNAFDVFVDTLGILTGFLYCALRKIKL